MPRKLIRVEVEIAARPEVVWRLLSEFDSWPKWGPTVRAVDSGDDRVAPGVRGRVQTPFRIWLPFVITAVEPGRYWHWRVAGANATGHAVVPIGEESCRVEFGVPRLFSPYAAVLRVGLRRLKALAEVP